MKINVSAEKVNESDEKTISFYSSFGTKAAFWNAGNLATGSNDWDKGFYRDVKLDEGNQELVISLDDLHQYSAGNETALVLLLKYNGDKKPSESATDEQKKAHKQKITIKSVELVAKD